jgi:hypothetical protein
VVFLGSCFWGLGRLLGLVDWFWLGCFLAEVFVGGWFGGFWLIVFLLLIFWGKKKNDGEK